ncbi:MAG TPA: hypothetical protein VHX20_02160 [Terracidiphilus sp.]|jgi:hypothetical protein|nr:hypothetical protein [Terracidiphilus sp.]
MPKIEQLFKLHTAVASGFVNYAPGDIAYITNGFSNNGVVGFVKPKSSDSVYRFTGLAVSAFGEATVQIPPFIARGNGGSGLVVLEPLKTMTADQLGYVAAHFNTQIRWRFSWSRMATVDRLKALEIPRLNSRLVRYQIRPLLPARAEVTNPSWKPQFREFPLDSLFRLEAGDYYNASDLPEGDIPLVSCGDRNNGIMGFVKVPETKTYCNKLTISFNGMDTLTTKYHPYRFAAKDDVAICSPRNPLKLATLFFVQLMMGREKWRYNYYRKCFMEKLKRQTVALPAKNRRIDESTIEAIVGSSPYWSFLEKRFTQG